MYVLSMYVCMYVYIYIYIYIYYMYTTCIYTKWAYRKCICSVCVSRECFSYTNASTRNTYVLKGGNFPLIQKDKRAGAHTRALFLSRSLPPSHPPYLSLPPSLAPSISPLFLSLALFLTTPPSPPRLTQVELSGHLLARGVTAAGFNRALN